MSLGLPVIVVAAADLLLLRILVAALEILLDIDSVILVSIPKELNCSSEVWLEIILLILLISLSILSITLKAPLVAPLKLVAKSVERTVKEPSVEGYSKVTELVLPSEIFSTASANLSNLLTWLLYR